MLKNKQIIFSTVASARERFDMEEFLHRYLIYLKEEIKFSCGSIEPFDDAVTAILSLFEIEANNCVWMDNIDRIMNLVFVGNVKPENIVCSLAMITEQYGGVKVLEETLNNC